MDCALFFHHAPDGDISTFSSTLAVGSELDVILKQDNVEIKNKLCSECQHLSGSILGLSRGE